MQTADWRTSGRLQAAWLRTSYTVANTRPSQTRWRTRRDSRVYSLTNYTHTVARMCLHSHTQRNLFKSESLSTTKSHRLCGYFSDIKLATSQHMRPLSLCFMKVTLDAILSVWFGSVDLYWELAHIMSRGTKHLAYNLCPWAVYHILFWHIFQFITVVNPLISMPGLSSSWCCKAQIRYCLFKHLAQDAEIVASGSYQLISMNLISVNFVERFA